MAERGQPEQSQGYEQDNRDTKSSNDLHLPNSTVPTDAERSENLQEKRTASRGFASMDREKQKRIASEGGRAAHRQGVAHEWSKDEAREAGRKGGQIVSKNRDHMSEIGRKGGQNSGQRRQQGDE